MTECQNISFGLSNSFDIWILKFDILILLAYLENSFLIANLHAETAVHAGQSIDLYTAVLSSNHRGTLEPFQAVPTSNASTHSRHIDR